MPTSFTFSFEGDAQISRTIMRPVEAIDDLRPVWEVLAGRFVAAETRQFATEGRYGSGGWAPLSPRYAAWKARHYPGKTILRRTDDLVKSLTTRPLGVEVIEPHYMILGTAVEYAKYHQHGTPRMPRRRPVELPESERREWLKVLQRFLVTGDVPSLGPRGGIRYGPPG